MCLYNITQKYIEDIKEYKICINSYILYLVKSISIIFNANFFLTLKSSFRHWLCFKLYLKWTFI